MKFLNEDEAVSIMGGDYYFSHEADWYRVALGLKKDIARLQERVSCELTGTKFSPLYFAQRANAWLEQISSGLNRMGIPLVSEQ